MNFNFKSQPLSTDEILPLANLYREVFATEPWNEFLKCSNPNCLKKFGKGQAIAKTLCPNCSAPLEDFYKLPELITSIEQIFQKAGFKIARLYQSTSTKSDLVGFRIGWETKLDALNKEKLELSDAQLEELTTTLPELKEDPDIFYRAELGLKPEIRGRGYGKKLFAFAEEMIPAPLSIMRTNINSRAFGIALQNGYRTIWKYQDESSRILFSKKI